MEEKLLEKEPKKKKKGCVVLSIISAAIFLGIILIVIAGNNSSNNDSTNEQLTNDGTNEQSAKISGNIEDISKDSILWNFRIETDEMTDSKNIWASIRSDNYINQDFPYEGNTYASITVRYMKKYGYDVLVKIDEGQIYGSEYSGNNYVTIRFDSTAAKKYYFNDAADGSSKTIFLKNAKDFIEKSKKAKDIKVDIPIYQSGRPIFSFHVDKPLEWPE